MRNLTPDEEREAAKIEAEREAERLAEIEDGDAGERGEDPLAAIRRRNGAAEAAINARELDRIDALEIKRLGDEEYRRIRSTWGESASSVAKCSKCKTPLTGTMPIVIAVAETPTCFLVGGNGPDRDEPVVRRQASAFCWKCRASARLDADPRVRSLCVRPAAYCVDNDLFTE